MLAVLSPAKSMNFDPLDGIPDSLPAFQDKSNQVAAAAKKLKLGEVKALMKLSDDLAKLNFDRFKAMGKESTVDNSKQAAFAFTGDTYQGLQIGEMSHDDLAYAQDHIRILSGLYGVLRPLDRIQPYRLEMGRRLETAKGHTLYAFWADTIGKALDEAANGGPVINCASNEYFKAAGKDMTSPVITPAFKEERGDGDLKMIGFFAKKARGMMARYIVENRVDQIDGLKDFNLEGYGFRADLSDAGTFTFTRKSAKAA